MGALGVALVDFGARLSRTERGRGADRIDADRAEQARGDKRLASATELAPVLR